MSSRKDFQKVRHTLTSSVERGVWSDFRKVQQIIKSSTTRSEVINKLGLSVKVTRNFRRLKTFIEEHKIDDSHLRSKGKNYAEYWRDLKAVVAKSHNVCEVLRKLEIAPHGSNHQRVRDEIRKRGLDISHFEKTRKLSAVQLIRNSRNTRQSVRRKVIRENLLEYKCSQCGLREWQGQELSLQLDHVNGETTDNRLENLRFLCPNCHSLTSTWGPKNRKEE